MADENLTVNVPSETTGTNAPEASKNDAERTYGDGQFKTVEELEQAYVALNTKSPTAAESDGKDTQQPADAPDATDDASRKEAGEALQGKGLDLGSFETEWQQSGALSEDSYKKLEKAGIPKAMVDSYIEGQQSLMQSFVGEVQQLAGGEEGYSTVTEWAKENMPPQEISAFNSIMNGGDRDAIKLAVTGLVSRYHAAEGSAPQLMSGKARAGGGMHDIFESTAQVTAAMRDPRYGKDPAYTKGIEEKMRRSPVFG